MASAFRRIGLGFAALALFFQLSLGAAVVDSAAAHQRMAEAGLCHTNDGPARHGPVHMPDCPLCPHSLALHAAPVLATGAAPLPAPATAPLRAIGFAQAARAPPAFAFARAYPRGPPILD